MIQVTSGSQNQLEVFKVQSDPVGPSPHSGSVLTWNKEVIFK